MLYGTASSPRTLPTALPGERHVGARRDAPGRRGTGAGGRPQPQPGDLRHHLDGAGGAADYRREPLPQLHRPRRVPDLSRGRAALHPHARRPLPRARRDDGRPHPGVLGGDHARCALAEVEVEAAPRSRIEAGRQAEPDLRRRRPRGLGQVLPLLRRRTADRAAAGRQVHDRARGRASPTSTRTRSGSPLCSAPPSPATPTTSSASTSCWSTSRETKASTCRFTSMAPAAASSGPSSTRTPSGTSGSSRFARSTSPGTSSASSTRASAGSSSARRRDLAEDLVFYENYLGKTDATFTLNFSTGASMVLAQYYNFVRFGRKGYTYMMKAMQKNAKALAEKLEGERQLRADRRRQGAAAAGRLQACRREGLRRVRPLLAALGRARLDASRLHDAAQRRRGEGAAGAGQADAQPRAGRPPRRRPATACEMLDMKGGAHPASASR